MRTKLKGFDIECTPEEFKQLVNLSKPEPKPGQPIKARRLKKTYHIWDMSMDKTLIELKGKGISPKEISKVMGITVPAVYSRWHKIKKKQIKG